jgi:transcriptional regulator
MELMELMVRMEAMLGKQVEMLVNPQKGLKVALLKSGLQECRKNHSLLELQALFKINHSIRFMTWDLMIFFKSMLRAEMVVMEEMEATDRLEQTVNKGKMLHNRRLGQMVDLEETGEMVEMLAAAKMEDLVAL